MVLLRRRPPPRPLAPLALLLRAPASGIMSVRASLPHHASGPRRIDPAEARIGKVLWRVRSDAARFAAGRSWPQVEPFRRPTAIPLDPKPTSAALVDTNFVPKSFAKGKRRLELAKAVAWSFWFWIQCSPAEVMGRVRSCQRGLQDSGSVARTGVFWLNRERLPLPSR